MTETPPAEQPTQAQAEAEAAADKVGVGAGAGGAEILEEFTQGNPGALGGGTTHSG